ncbi:MAG TPA: chemotaxis protein CheB [Novosphingobium sp.]|nr:chemotaxis protein CheB [Novosphingobium sp.]
MFLTVGIGASAGGLDAFKSFFAAMPGDTGMAFVLVQHLSPDHKSMLAELLGRTTGMDVIEATDGVSVKPDCVFVIPPDATMTIDGGRLKIARPAPPRDRRRPIDTFFQSLAEDQGESAICIILSGTGSDGAQGLAAVKEHGGFTLAQAEFDHHAMPGMPQSAANTGLVDEVLAVESMPGRIIAYQNHLADVADGKDEDGVRKDAVSHLTGILRALHARSGHDFSEYKEKTLVRRLQRRMQILHVETPGAYRQRIAEKPEELDALLRELLIGVTQFFRDPPAFDALNDSVLKGLVEGRGADEDIRVWVPGCATGEEAYSIAILLREAMDTRRPRPKVQIFGTDLDERAIAAARLGRYRKPIAGLSHDHAERWFASEGTNCCVVPEIREMCIFSAHSIIKHPPFSKLDLISCRNLLIYLDAPMQDRVMRTFHYGLKPGGRLFLGSSESVTRASKLFSVQDKKHRIFERRDVPNAGLPPFYTDRTRERTMPDPKAVPSDDRIDRNVRRMMERHAPPHLVLDHSNHIVRFSGGAMGQYLEPSPGAPSFALFDILRKALRPAAREILQDVRNSSEPVRRNDISIRVDGKLRLVSLAAERLAESGPEADLVVLALYDTGLAAPRAKTGETAEASPDATQALEQELRTTRTQLQSTIDELETANEEMKSTNEEYQSVNEELQSSNEELETAKEEMQSVNEELQTINSEVASKNEQLTLLNSDLTNLFESAEIATLFLDEGLRVRRFTRGIGDVFHLRDADIGRPITEIVSLLDYKDLQRDVKAVLRKLAPIEREVTLEDTKATFILRIRPYRTVVNVIDGVVLTFVDITERRVANDAVVASELKFRTLFDLGPVAVYSCDVSGVIDSFNRRAVELWGREPASGNTDERFCGSFKMFRPDGSFMPHELCPMAEVLGGKISEVRDAEVLIERPDGSRVMVVVNIRPVENQRGEVTGAINCFYDITERLLHEEQQELLLREMDHRVKNLFAITGGVVSLSARGAATPQEMAEKVQGRLGALATAHQLVRPHRSEAGSAQGETTLAEIVATILRAYTGKDDSGEENRVMIDGPDVVVGGDAVTSVAMVLHELATNAAKYGSLLRPDGSIRVSWTIKRHRLELLWIERGGPPIGTAPLHEGFGSMLARRSVTGQLDGELDYEWNAEGLTARLSAPVERLVQ